MYSVHNQIWYVQSPLKRMQDLSKLQQNINVHKVSIFFSSALPPTIQNLPTSTAISVQEHQVPGQFIYRVIASNRQSASQTVPPVLTYNITNPYFTIDKYSGEYVLCMIEYVLDMNICE